MVRRSSLVDNNGGGSQFAQALNFHTCLFYIFIIEGKLELMVVSS